MMFHLFCRSATCKKAAHNLCQRLTGEIDEVWLEVMFLIAKTFIVNPEQNVKSVFDSFIVIFSCFSDEWY
jgi:hypothetical protein